MAAGSFDWSEYLRLAEKLSKGSDEASLRSSISRAYYFVYHLALTRARENGFAPKLDQPMHTQLWVVFSGNPEPECQRLAMIGNRMRGRRVRADYEPFFVRVEEEAGAVLEDAEEFANRLGKLDRRHPNPRSQRR
jgi:uncharacterized protein (UPF0332 family)